MSEELCECGLPEGDWSLDHDDAACDDSCWCHDYCWGDYQHDYRLATRREAETELARNLLVEDGRLREQTSRLVAWQKAACLELLRWKRRHPFDECDETSALIQACSLDEGGAS